MSTAAATLEAAPARWRSVPDRFRAHARSSPDALAVEAGDERLGYAGLAARVDRFAARLAPRLGGSEPLVGVCLERDANLPAWLLAVFEAGGAYLPLDPGLPPARLAHVLEDGAPRLIVAARRYASLFAGAGVPLIVAEDEEDLPPATRVQVRSDALAYVIFTSGSTGRPKGVEIEHGSLAALMETMVAVPGFARGERMLGLTRISFDLSVPDMFLPFCAGGSLALVDLDVAADPDRLAAAFARYRPDVAQGTPSTWLTLLENGWQGARGLRIFAGGEAMTRTLADRLLPRVAALWNIYGPTETTVWSTCGRVAAGAGPVPIGWPMHGDTVAIADRELRPVATGCTGEIVIGGTGVARGYRGRPDLTAERFVALPDGSRVYRTGDLGRFDDAGALLYLGRADDQIKLRGFRIELGDVEAALSLHPDIAWSAARLWTDPVGNPTLVGHVVPRPGTAPEARAIKGFLADHLATYMIPDRIVALPAMPLTPNGKVDRSRLPSPFGIAAAPVGAATVEDRLAAIWCELLGVPQVRREDDFFDLGGYSLMTVRLVRRIEAAFGTRLAPIDLLRHSTLAGMTARIERGDDGTASPVMLLNEAGDRPPLYWLDAGPLMRGLVRALPKGQPAFSLNTDASDEDALGIGPVSIAAVAARLRARLTAVQPAGPYYIGGWCRWGIVAFELAQQLAAEGRTVALLVLLDAERPRPARRWRQLLTGRLPHRASGPVAEPASVSQRIEAAMHRYAPRPYLGDMLLLLPQSATGDGGWRSVVHGALMVERSSGDHLSMVRPPHVAGLATRLDSALAAHQDARTAMSPSGAARSAFGMPEG